MNTFVQSAKKQSNMAKTENGAASLVSTNNCNLDLFAMIGSVNNDSGYNKAIELFRSAVKEDRELAIRVLLYSRDARGGLGRREAFRRIMKHATEHRILTKVQMEKIIRKMIPELGRFDDLETFFGTKYEEVAVKTWLAAIKSGNALAAKWAPRKDKKGAKPLRKAMGMNEASWRKYLVERTNVVETLMCDNKFNEINYSHVPSVAFARYRKAFSRNDNLRFSDFIQEALDGNVKVNANMYPHDIVRGIIYNSSSRNAAEAQWRNLPDDIFGEEKILPIIDTSASMNCLVSGSVRAIDIAVGLGIYVAERNKSAFKNLWMTFSTSPRFHTINENNDIFAKCSNIYGRNDWTGSTDIEKAFSLILDTAVRNNVRDEDMPEKILIVSDMQFNCMRQPNSTAFEMIASKYEQHGYKLPRIVFWQVNARGTATPVEFNERGVAVVSGFSTAILKAVAGEYADPYSVMINAVMSDRYKI